MTIMKFTTIIVTVATVVAVVVVMPEKTEAGQANMDQSMTFWSMSHADKLVFMAEYLVTHDDLIKKMLKIAESLKWMEEGTNGNPAGNAMVPMILDALPDVFNSSVFKLTSFLIFDEISRAVPRDPVTQEMLFNQTVEALSGYGVPVFSAPFNDTFQKLANRYMLQHANWPRAANRFLEQFSARDVLAEVSPNRTTVNPQCYSDTMDFIDAAIGGIVVNSNFAGPGPEPLNLEHYGWAIKMLDSYGKPRGGILKGAIYFLGSHDECHSVHAYLPKNHSLLLGRRPHDHVTEFDTRFCRTTFDLPESFTDNLGVDTRGIKLRLHWGMCLPDTCHSDDVAAMFHLGPLYPYDIPVHSVYCIEDQDLGDDGAAITGIVILALLGGTVVICTLLEALIIFYNNNCLPSGTPSNSSIEDPEAYNKSQPAAVYENVAYQHTEEKGEKLDGSTSTSGPTNGELTPNYVPHKESDPTLKEGLEHSQQVVVASAYGDGGQKRSSPPPSYTARADNSINAREKPVPRIVKAFSILTNMPKILSGKKSPNAIHCLHGIRFFSMLWIVYGHTYNYGVTSVSDNPTTVNLVDADAFFHRFTFQGIMAGGYAVDTFFLLSALLVTYLTLKDLAKSKKKIGYWVMFYVHRFWRLTPLYMMVLMTFTCLHTYLGGGPLWPGTLKTAMDCRETWWTNLLYVNNLVKVDKMCMGWTWYLSNDMQFYWISPIFLIPLFFVAPVGLVMMVLLLCAGIICSFYFEHKNGGDVFSMKEDNRYWEEVYIAPWCRVGAYAVGMLLGYIFYKFKRTTLKLSTAVIGWLLTWAVGLFLCYITYTKNKSGASDWNIWEYSAFESFGRPAWAACVGWIIFACHNNRGGFINSILSWEGFLPVSRLTYATYLVHPVIMMLHVFSLKELIYIDDYTMTYLYMGHVVTAFLTAFFFSLVAEAPALALEKMVFRMR